MNSRSPNALLIACLLALSTQALRAEVTLDSVLPAEGTVGSSLVLQLTSDAGGGKVKAWLTRADDTTATL